MSALTSATLILARSLGMSTLKIVLTSPALIIAAQSTLSGSTVTKGAADPAVADADADGLAADWSTLAGEALAASEPEGTAPLETVTTAVTVRWVPVLDPHPETISSPAIAAASTR